MKHRDRQWLADGLSDLMQDAYGLQSPNLFQAALSARLDPLLDAFLLESQPIREVDATILIADIRGFTMLTETNPPQTVIRVLNLYFTRMVEVVRRNGGVVDKFMGDAVMAVFGAPVRRDDHMMCALACAAQMQQAVIELNRENQAAGDPVIFAGIALSSGRVMAGSFGSRLYSEYTVIGDSVNLAARLDGFSLRGQVLISDFIYQSTHAHIDVSRAHCVFVKGKAQEITFYELLAVRDPIRLEVPQVEVRRSPRVPVDFPIAMRRVQSKHIQSRRFFGKANDLGYFGMNADLPMQLPAYAELILNFVPDLGTDQVTEIYARVLRTAPSNGMYRTNLEFTSIDTPGHRFIKRYVDDLLWRH